MKDAPAVALNCGQISGIAYDINNGRETSDNKLKNYRIPVATVAMEMELLGQFDPLLADPGSQLYQEKRAAVELQYDRALRSRHAYFEHAQNKRSGIVANTNRCKVVERAAEASWRDLHDRIKSAVKALRSVVV
ncbi:hypothetical protein DPMN_165638 [Dreissena polymorpha]|uniref:Uncharacterized protein n=1 Tax=Dreissena polymorpha TaxID=45954 RepID=A0A9D4EXK6_DREPO|nr:hypothetical protein DPMN_165638 [Dreissena polymorpha]